MEVARANGGITRASARIVLLVFYLCFTLPVVPLVAASLKPLSWMFAIDLSVRAVPLYLTWLLDAAFYDGGELSPQMMPVWVVLTGLVFWPLPLLAIRPALWQADGWRKTITVYAAIMAVATSAAAAWVFTHLGVFF